MLEAKIALRKNEHDIKLMQVLTDPSMHGNESQMKKAAELFETLENPDELVLTFRYPSYLHWWAGRITNVQVNVL